MEYRNLNLFQNEKVAKLLNYLLFGCWRCSWLRWCGHSNWFWRFNILQINNLLTHFSLLLSQKLNCLFECIK